MRGACHLHGGIWPAAGSDPGEFRGDTQVRVLCTWTVFKVQDHTGREWRKKAVRLSPGALPHLGQKAEGDQQRPRNSLREGVGPSGQGEDRFLQGAREQTLSCRGGGHLLSASAVHTRSVAIVHA